MFFEVLLEFVDFMIKLNNYVLFVWFVVLLNKIRECFFGRKIVE